MELDFDRCYRAVDSRDQRFDGWFYTAVRTTGIYCRPSCPAVTPKRANVEFHPSAAAAQRGGFRACRRCRPDAAPGSPDWDTRADLVGRAMRLIGDGVVDRDGVPGLAARLGYTERHLHRMLAAELGAGPLALARAQRAQTALTLIETTELGLADIAFAAGFGSVRQFNDTIQQVYAEAPSKLRQRRPMARTGAGTISLRLAYRAPLHAPAMLAFFAAHALPGVEECDAGTYRRVLHLPHGTATAALTPTERWVAVTLRLTDLRDLAPAVARCRRLFDLDADPVAIDATLRADPALSAMVAAEPGVRVPRTVDGFELAVRTIVGHQISVGGARTALTHLVRHVHPSTGTPSEHVPVCGPGLPAGGPGLPAGGPGLRPFPSADQLAELPDEAFRMPAARRARIQVLARRVASGKLNLEPGTDRRETASRLADVPGIDPWVLGYLAMRATGDPDVMLATDLAARRGARTLGLPATAAGLHRHAERWRPWRSYALIRLWRSGYAQPSYGGPAEVQHPGTDQLKHSAPGRTG